MISSLALAAVAALVHGLSLLIAGLVDTLPSNPTPGFNH